MPTPTTDAVAPPPPSAVRRAWPTWSIAQVADEFGVTHRTVRHYEELGLISPERRGTTRVYHRRDRTRLALILRGKRLGFPLEEIRTIIDLYDVPRGRRSQLEYVLGQIDERRADLEQRRRDLDAALSELAEFEAPAGPTSTGSALTRPAKRRWTGRRAVTVVLNRGDVSCRGCSALNPHAADRDCAEPGRVMTFDTRGDTSGAS